MSAKFSGRVALVAGGTGGLGRAVSTAFLNDGAQVVVTYRAREEWESLSKSTDAVAERLEGREVDVTNEAAVQQLVGEIQQRHNRLDAMVNAVGGYAAGQRLWEMDPKILDRMLNLNLRATFVLARGAASAMFRQGHGAIVNVASMAAVDHAAAAAAYAASKSAAVAIIDSLAADLKGSGVRANSILPSIIDTEANRKAMPNADFSKWPKPEDLARVILFLCSDDAKAVNGASIPV